MFGVRMWDLAAVKLRGGPGGPPREVVARVQRDRLFRAMAEVTSERGYGDTGMRALLERARVSRITFYELFEDKLECFLAAYAEAIDDAVEAVGASCSEGGDAADRIRRGLRTLMERCRDEPAVARMCTVEILAAGPKGREARERTIERFAGLLEPPLRELYGDGGSNATRTRAMVGAVHEATYRLLQASDPEGLPDAVGEIVELYLRPGTG
jgi:AcrR family transcriptional regulator